VRNNQRIICLICWLSLFITEIYSQTDFTFGLEDLLEQFIETGEEEESNTESYLEELMEIHANPFNLNAVTKEQLETFPFLSENQIESILYYIDVYGPMQTIYELQMVSEMDWQTIQLILPFVCVKQIVEKEKFPSLKNMLTYGKQEIVTRLDIPFYKRAGYYSYPDSVLAENPNKKYTGSPYYHSLRYSYRYKNQLHVGLTAEKDAGEPFFAKHNKKGYDYYSFYFLLQNIGRLKALAIGNYRLNLGLGLIINQEYGLGKSSALGNIRYNTTQIRKHSSTDEYNYFRGVAASYQLNKLIFTGFYSHRPVDGIVENQFITSIQQTGMHRTPREFERKNSAINQVIGGNLSFHSNHFKIGTTIVYNFFNKVLNPDSKPYSVFYPRGKDFFNVGVNYHYRWKRIAFLGETAFDKKGSMAALHVIKFTPITDYQLLFLHRYYARDYEAIYAKSISENSSIRNEEGIYMGVEARPIRYWKFSVYGDFFSFPWLRYGVDKPSTGFDGLLQANYTPKRNINMFWRYRYKTKDKNYRNEENIKEVIPFNQHKIRYQFNYQFKEQFSLRSTIDMIYVCPEHTSYSKGFMLMQALSYRTTFLPLLFDINYGIFDTDNYESRVSIYEKSPLYSFSVPGFYGKGTRAALNIRYEITAAFTIYLKLAQTKYLDREQISSGLEQINNSKKTDLYLQLRYKI